METQTEEQMEIEPESSASNETDQSTVSEKTATSEQSILYHLSKELENQNDCNSDDSDLDDCSDLDDYSDLSSDISYSDRSDNSEVDEDEDEVAPPAVKNWGLIGTFQTRKEVEDHIIANDCEFSSRSTVQQVRGFKRKYRCKAAKRLGEQCDREYYTLNNCPKSDDDNSSGDEDGANGDEEGDNHQNDIGPFKLFCNSLPHSHETLQNKSKRISQKIKDKILELRKVYPMPKSILLAFGSEKDVERDEIPSIRQIKNVIENAKRKEDGRPPLTMAQLTEYVESHTDIPNDDDEAYVVAFERSESNVHPANGYYRLFISTKNLLRGSAESKNIHADATHKITTEKKPLLIIGSTDAAKKFHFIGMTITSHENASAYEMSFRSVRKGILENTGNLWKPEALVADADPAIHNGFHAAFEDESLPVIMCYSHVMRNVQTKYSFSVKQNKPLMMNDIRVLHLAYSKEIFDIGCKLFIEKWRGIEEKVVDVFVKSFIKKNNTWYIGSRPRIPKDDNMLENFNGDIKKHQTDFKRSPLKRFLKFAMKMVRQRSREYINHLAPFQSEVIIPPEILLRGSEYNNDFLHIVQPSNNTVGFFMFSSTANSDQPITLQDVIDFNRTVYESWDHFKDNAFKMWKVTLPDDKNNWLQESTCTCPAFDAKYVCKHIVFIAVKLKLLQPSTAPTGEANYDNEPLFQLKKGRPKRAGPALEKD